MLRTILPSWLTIKNLLIAFMLSPEVGLMGSLQIAVALIVIEVAFLYLAAWFLRHLMIRMTSGEM